MVYIDHVCEVLFVDYHKSSNKHPGAYLIFHPQKGGSYSSGGRYSSGILIFDFSGYQSYSSKDKKVKRTTTYISETLNKCPLLKVEVVGTYW